MTETNPWFPYSYPQQGNYDVASSSYRRTVSDELKLTTFERVHPEVRRRFVGLQLFLFEWYGVRLGIGTGWRVQPANEANHASPGNSWHEGVPIILKKNALAIDTVGFPSHPEAWAAMEKHLREFGFTSFTQPQIPANYNHQNRAYTGSWDRPHIQPYEINYSRSFTTLLPNLTKWAIPARYDLDLINVNDPLAAPLPAPPDIPNIPDDPNGEDVLKAIIHHNVPNGAYCCLFSGGYKTWIAPDGTYNIIQNMRVIGGEQPMPVTEIGDAATFRALGPVVGPHPGFDDYCVPL